MSLANFITQRRSSKGWQRSTLAKRCKCTYFCVYSWEIGRTLPRASQVKRLAKALDVQPDVIQRLIDVSRA